MIRADDNRPQRITEILQSNNAIKKSTSQIVKEYLQFQKQFFDKVGSTFQILETVQSVADIFLTGEQERLLKEFEPLEKVQLAICGYNSVGKTTLVHELLECGSFLPTGIGAVSARIVKFSYAPANEACLIKYQSKSNPNESEEKVDLSSHFISPKGKINTKTLKETIKKYVARPHDMNPMLDEFEKWASHLIEIRIPSPFLQHGIDIYDTPGFLNTDPPILAKNLLELISSKRPSIVYLYDNAVVSDDSRKCFEQLQLALHLHFQGTAIFFLNTKADVLTIRKDAGDDYEGDDELHGPKKEEPEDRLLNNEREKRYKLLLNVSEMSSTILGGKHLPVDQCDCFDIFSSQGSTDPMETKIKTHAMNSIIDFAAEHDLRSTKQIINIILGTIDDFFDFVLVTNRRSTTEWKKIYERTIQWYNEYFTEYQSHIDEIVKEAKTRLPTKFSQQCDDIEKRALPHCVTTRWEQIYTYALNGDRLGFLSSSTAINYINMVVENEVIKPVLHEITLKISKNTKEKIDRTKKSLESTKNELLMAAYRAVMMNSDEYGAFYPSSSFNLITKMGILLAAPALLISATLNYGLHTYMSLISKRSRTLVDIEIYKIEWERKAAVHKYILDLQENLGEMSKLIKENMQKWLEKNRIDFISKVDRYYSLVHQTLKEREVAYKLAREFAPRFAQFECSLVANLDLAKHHGRPLTIQRDTFLGQGGFFNIFPATWDSEQNFVVKELINPTEDRDIACLEAHFHRTVTRLDIAHMVPLEYLYETVKDPQQFVVVLRRYPQSLHSYLMKHMKEMTIDKAVQISLDISRAIALMHNYELVHRDVKVHNILLDANDQVYLADFGTCQHGTENSTYIGSRPFVPELITGDHEYSYQGSAFDVFCLGVLMYVVAPKDAFHQPRTLAETDVHSLDKTRVPDSYCDLIRRCIKTEPTLRPKADEVVEELGRIVMTIANTKPCLVCLGALRTTRCLPCQHKTMCRTCLDAAQKANQEPQCIICREVFTNFEEDADNNTYISVVRPITANQ